MATIKPVNNELNDLVKTVLYELLLIKYLKNTV